MNFQSSRQYRSQLLDNKSLRVAAAGLARRDKHLAEILSTYGPPPLWERPTGFATLAQIILEQQVSLRSAAAIFARLNSSVQPFDPEHLRGAGEDYLRTLGITRQKAAYLVHLATLIVEGRLNFTLLTHMSDDSAKQALMAVKGIGPWSADVYLLMAMRRADIWPSGDLALAIAAKEVKQLTTRPGPGKLEELAESWRPHRAVAARMLWQYYLSRKNDPKSLAVGELL